MWDTLSDSGKHPSSPTCARLIGDENLIFLLDHAMSLFSLLYHRFIFHTLPHLHLSSLILISHHDLTRFPNGFLSARTHSCSAHSTGRTLGFPFLAPQPMFPDCPIRQMLLCCACRIGIILSHVLLRLTISSLVHGVSTLRDFLIRHSLTSSPVYKDFVPIPSWYRPTLLVTSSSHDIFHHLPPFSLFLRASTCAVSIPCIFSTSSVAQQHHRWAASSRIFFHSLLLDI